MTNVLIVDRVLGEIIRTNDLVESMRSSKENISMLTVVGLSGSVRHLGWRDYHTHHNKPFLTTIRVRLLKHVIHKHISGSAMNRLLHKSKLRRRQCLVVNIACNHGYSCSGVWFDAVICLHGPSFKLKGVNDGRVKKGLGIVLLPNTVKVTTLQAW